MGFLAWIILGLIAGAIAKLIHPGPDPGGWIASLLIGIVGAVVGGFVFNLVGMGGATGVNLWSIIVAVVGAVICLAIYRRVA
ncbi:GlsB/YeaQ/YmgE family stress response membrane protein [Neolewinella antarctica]|uniref:Membrane protein YeaQ/YmgE (Transglycosylase-associated protein family) n=1 Tax=Neolewinella antarctica TaxID=442734 RepID=A0ABX0XG60_9BACT|nr:GlsB/YeaQ/YmgE family stress response membrane protein [Neolewinella antarctica]NJC28298.1 putative membrane protein YeaQ/YmgE (transglycosylase-associated protein family) [Neolewinella antarctica]